MQRILYIFVVAIISSTSPRDALCNQDEPAREKPRPEITTKVYSKDGVWYCELMVFNESNQLITIQRRLQGFQVKNSDSHTIAMEIYRDADAVITLMPQEGFIRRTKILDKAVPPGHYSVELDYRLKARFLGKSEAPPVMFVVAPPGK